MTAHTWQIGQSVPVEGRWRITDGPLPSPVWHALRVRGGLEAKAAAKLTPHVAEVIYPVEDREYLDAKRRARVVSRASVPGLIYAKFENAPRWHALKERGIITGVVCRETPFGYLPICLGPNTMRKVMGLPTEAERIAAERAEAMRIRPGDKARLLQGPLAGLVVDVREVAGGRIWWANGWAKGSADSDAMQRIAPD